MPSPDEVVGYGPHPSQRVELWLPEDGPPAAEGVALLLHGGYWRDRYDLRLMDPLSADLAQRGWIAVNAEYRRVGADGGGWPATFDDVRAAAEVAADLADEHHLPLVVVGHSAGGQLALWVAGEVAVDAVVALAPVADLEEASRRGLSDHAAHGLLGGSPADHPARYAAASPVRRLPLSTPVLLVHGDADAHVPVALSDALADQLRAAGDEVAYLRPVGVDHFAPIDPGSPEWHQVMGWLAEVPA